MPARHSNSLAAMLLAVAAGSPPRDQYSAHDQLAEHAERDDCEIDQPAGTGIGLRRALKG